MTRDKLYYTAGGEIYSIARKWESTAVGQGGRPRFYAILLPRSSEVVPTAANPSAAASRSMELRRRHAGLVADEMYCHLIVNRLFTEPVINTRVTLIIAVVRRRKEAHADLGATAVEIIVNLRHAACDTSEEGPTDAHLREFTAAHRKKSPCKSQRRPFV